MITKTLNFLGACLWADLLSNVSGSAKFKAVLCYLDGEKRVGGVGWMKYLFLDCLFVLLFLNLDSVTPCACEHAVCKKLLYSTSWFNVALRSYGYNVLEFRYR